MTRASVRESRTSTGLVRQLAVRRRREISDVRRPGCPAVRIDRVLVCPSGVHVVTETIGQGEVAPAQVAAGLRSARAVADLLPPRYRARVRPVLCTSQDDPVAELVRGVLVTSSATFEHVLRSTPVVLSTSEVNEVAARLEARLEPYPARPAKRSRWWTWRVWSAVAGGAAAAAAGVGVLAPEALRLPLP